jgi:hypothetical protein
LAASFVISRPGRPTLLYLIEEPFDQIPGAVETPFKAVLATVVLTAILGFFDVPALLYMWRVNRLDLFAAVIALVAVLLFWNIERHCEMDEEVHAKV